MKSIFVIVVKPKDLCHYCDVYKANQHDKLIDLIEKDRRIDYIYLEAVKTPQEKHLIYLDGEKYISPHLYEEIYGKWYPNFMLFTKESWFNPNKELKGYIYGGDPIINDKGVLDLKEIPGEYDTRAENIMQWIIDKLDTPIFNSKRIIKYKQHTTDNRNAMIRRGSL